MDALRNEESNGGVLCFGCFKSIEELDVVQVVSCNSDVPQAAVGEVGAVLMVHTVAGEPAGYEIECVLPDGTSKWQGVFMREQIKWLPSSR
ncbi:hypothetical protein [Nitrogeniibacter aestuarii]|uniref:hypothetical protein n=1 Tax=Nitrogeniibacter aestuarii TaxID=2815343 RepID=UPI001E3FE278|nr:hypothetical protein [Nitrogeniibacter aestuarii]